MKAFKKLYLAIRHLLGMDALKHPHSKRGRGDDFHHE
jgi:hypothetical protein